MSLNNSQYDALMRQYNQKQLKHKHEQRDRIRIAYKRIPRLQEIDNEIASLSLKKPGLFLCPLHQQISISLMKLKHSPKNAGHCFLETAFR